jgi:hypothetical protein
MTTPRILLPSDPEWSELLQRTPHDFYHTAAYHAFSERAGEGLARMAVVGDGDRFLLWPYLQRPAHPAGCPPSEEWFDIHSVYGYPGPLAGSGATRGFLHEAMNEMVALWRAEQVASVFSRFHPLLDNASLLLCTGFADAVTPNGKTVSLNVTRTDEAFRAYYPQKLRQRLNRASRSGARTTVDEDFSHLDEFVRFYHATMDRNQASESYYFTSEYFHRLVRDMAPHMKLMLTTMDDQLAVASLFAVHGPIVQAHFIMTNPDLLQHSPAKAAIDHVRVWAREQGCRYLHLGGGRGGSNDSLFAFKAEFSPDHHPFFTCRLTVNEEACHQLSLQRAESARRLGLPAGEPAYFPSYRAPLPAAVALTEKEPACAS